MTLEELIQKANVTWDDALTPQDNVIRDYLSHHKIEGVITFEQVGAIRLNHPAMADRVQYVMATSKRANRRLKKQVYGLVKGIDNDHIRYDSAMNIEKLTHEQRYELARAIKTPHIKFDAARDIEGLLVTDVKYLMNGLQDTNTRYHIVMAPHRSKKIRMALLYGESEEVRTKAIIESPDFRQGVRIDLINSLKNEQSTYDACIGANNKGRLSIAQTVYLIDKKVKGDNLRGMAYNLLKDKLSPSQKRRLSRVR